MRFYKWYLYTCGTVMNIHLLCSYLYSSIIFFQPPPNSLINPNPHSLYIFFLYRFTRSFPGPLLFVASCSSPHMWEIECPTNDPLCFFFFFRGAPAHMEVPRLRVELDLQLPAHATATAMPDLSLVYDALSKARDRTSWIPVRFVSAEP